MQKAHECKRVETKETKQREEIRTGDGLRELNLEPELPYLKNMLPNKPVLNRLRELNLFDT